MDWSYWSREFLYSKVKKGPGWLGIGGLLMSLGWLCEEDYESAKNSPGDL